MSILARAASFRTKEVAITGKAPKQLDISLQEANALAEELILLGGMRRRTRQDLVKEMQRGNMSVYYMPIVVTSEKEKVAW